jgi:CheY-like chemotaxis protein
MVLIVDGDEESRTSTARLVAAFGARVQTARDGEEALRMVHAAPPDLLLCDPAMPSTGGVALVTAVRTAPSLRRMLVVAITGLATPGAVAETWTSGFDAHVLKPITGSVLTRLLERVAPRPREGTSTAG